MRHFLRPYLAILKDSYREALASRVLWILLVLITMLLLALIPIQISAETNWLLEASDLRDASQLVSVIYEQSQAEDPSVGRRIWSLLDEDGQQRWIGWAEPPTDEKTGPFVFNQQLADVLNEMLERPDFYEKTSWSKFRIPRDISSLLERTPETLAESEHLRLNRRLLELAFSTEIVPTSGEAYYFSYFTWDVPVPVANSWEERRLAISTTIAALIAVFVGAIGVFVAILVTASIIPHTFDGGAIDLLLSKPISRVLLFLTKFAGGCAFILLCAGYFLFGLWLIVGTQLGVWANGLLLCVPIFLFLFAIYYSVSALAGVVWRNTIVCVVMTILFWAACSVVGYTRALCFTLAILPSQLEQLIRIDEGLAATTKSGEVVLWDSADRQWQSIFAATEPEVSPMLHFGAALIGPIYDHRQQRLLAVPVRQFPMRRVQDYLVVGRKEDDWSRIEGNHLPSWVRKLFIDKDGQVIAVTPKGIYRLEGDLEAPVGPDRPITIAGFELPWSTRTEETYRSIGLEPWLSLSSRFTVDMHPVTSALAFYDRQTLILLERDEQGKYTRKQELDVDADKKAVIGFSGTTVVLATENGQVHVIDTQRLKESHSFSPFGETTPRYLATAPNGRWFAIGFHNEKVSLFDAKRQRESDLYLAGQGNLTVAAFTDTSSLLLADHRKRVFEYELDPFSKNLKLDPKLTRFEYVYRYFINPIYTIFPKPGELDSAVAYLLTDQDTMSVSPNDSYDALGGVREKLDVWTPIWSSLAFVAVILTIGSWYVHRKDF